MWNPHRFALLTAALLTVAPARLSRADVRVEYSRHRSKAEADIDSLKSRMLDAQRLLVEYEIEIEDARSYEAFDLVLEIRPRGRRHAAERVQPITFVVPLDRPTDVDDDEMEFETRVVLDMPDGTFIDPQAMRLYAVVVPRGGDRVLDREDASIRTRYRVSRRYYSFGVGFGYYH